MIDITKYPYFSHGDALAKLSEPLMRMANVELSSFSRKTSDEKKIIIANNKGVLIDYYAREFYRYGLFEKPQKWHQSGYHMWDHLPCDPHGIYDHARRVHNIAHGLTVIKQYGDYTDIFLFVTKPGNAQVNNFYLNEKELINQVIDGFYEAMEPTIQDLEKHKIFIPYNTNFYPGPVASLSPRQMDCALLMTEGHTAKEIGKALDLSHRTVEDYIEVLKHKFEAKNRLHLIKLLQKHL
jgi:DNA-binding CsgD family transcriptional regulator